LHCRVSALEASFGSTLHCHASALEALAKSALASALPAPDVLVRILVERVV
jgi:hypothetical protein